MSRPGAADRPGGRQAVSPARVRSVGGAWALAAALLAAVATATAVSLVRADGHVTVGWPASVTDPGGPGIVDANNSPTIVRHPRNGDHLVVVNRMDQPRFSAALHWSEDGGASWTRRDLPLPAGSDRPFAPDAVFAPDGTLYVVYVNLAGRGNVPDTVWLARSHDGGRTISAPVRVADRLTFQPRVATGPDGVVHVTFLAAEEVGLLRFAGPVRIVTRRSDDGGRTFAPPVTVSGPEQPRVGAATPAVDSAGDVIVLYQDFGGDLRDFENLEGPPWPEPFALVAARSSDGGSTFTRVVVDDGLVADARFLAFLPPSPSIAAGPDGSLSVAWSDARDGDADVRLRRSGDGGRSWTDPVRVNDNPTGDGTDQFLPRVAVAPGGRLDVVFLDRRHDPAGVMTDVTLATSSDQGGTFRNVEVTDEPFDSRIGTRVAPYLEPDLGSRLGLVATDAAALPAWTDTRLGTVDSGRQDILMARVTIPDAAALQRRWRLVLGALGGAVLALGGWVASRSGRQRALRGGSGDRARPPLTQLVDEGGTGQREQREPHDRGRDQHPG